MRRLNTGNSPQDMIESLDHDLEETGQEAILRRRIGTSPTYVDVGIVVKMAGYGTADLSSGIKVTDSQVIFSPTPIVAAGANWPGAAGGSADPKIGDFIFTEGRLRKLEQVDNVRVRGVWVRSEGRVSG